MIGRINSAAQIGRLNRVKRKTAEGGWWLAGGISPSDCVAAYQAKGVTDYATSKVNLANPGTYNLTEGVSYPSWDTDDGWKRTDTDQYLKTGVIAVNGMALIARCSDVTYSNRNHCAGGSIAYGKGISLMPLSSHPHRSYWYGGVVWISGGAIASGVMAVTPNVNDLSQAQGYLNGTLDATISIDSENFGGDEICITNNAVDRSGTLNVQAAAIYSVPLTAGQVAALTAAMAAL